EILGDDGRADLVAAGKPGHRGLVEAEAAEVVAEIEHASRHQPHHGRPQQAHVLVLDVEIAGAGGVGEGGRVAEDQVVLAALGVQPGHGVGLHELVGAASQVVFAQVVGQPLQVGGGKVHAGG